MVERRIKWIFDPIHLGKDFVTIYSVVDKYGFSLINGDADPDLEEINLTICAKEKEDRYTIRFYFTDLINILDGFLYAHRTEVEKGYVNLTEEWYGEECKV